MPIQGTPLGDVMGDAVEGAQQKDEIKRLGDEPFHPPIDRFKEYVLVDGGHQNDRGFGSGAADLAHQIESREPRHHLVSQHHVRRVLVEKPKALLAIGGRYDGFKEPLDPHEQHAAAQQVVLHQ